MRVGFVDNDIFLKLIAFQLFDDAIALLNLQPDQLCFLPTAKFVFRRERDRQRRYSPEIWDQAIAYMESCATLPELVFTPELLQELQALEVLRDQIHEGESRLILGTWNVPDFVLMSGDKNCFRALPSLPDAMYQRLQGRVVCLEQIMLELIQALGFEQVYEVICPSLQWDQTIRICFGYSEPQKEADVLQGLKQYIQDIQDFAPGLLIEL